MIQYPNLIVLPIVRQCELYNIASKVRMFENDQTEWVCLKTNYPQIRILNVYIYIYVCIYIHIHVYIYIHERIIIILIR